MTSRIRGAVLFAALAFLTHATMSPTYLFAAPPTDAQRALDLGYEGDALFEKGKWDEAFERFQQADALAHSPVFVVYMARCRRKAGRLIEAAALYARVTAEALPANAPKPFVAALADASAELKDVRSRIPSVRVEVRGRSASEVELRVDGRVIAAGDVVELDPGSHVVLATAPGAEARKTVELKEGSREVAVELVLEPGRGAASEPKITKGSLVPGILTLSLAALGLELGAIAGGLAARDASSVKEGCVGNHCLRDDAETLDRAKLLATASTVGFVVGGVSLATGIVLIAVRPGGGEASPTVTVGPTGAQLQLSF